ncbi:AIM24 family protein [Kribbella sp. NPDC056345]|uniref:AIM24 family protein n=1 Tax=Kribbella albertanoniae TaxID=1266829 RepID=A0A4R4P3K0_9ACTN|nr:AIM24 family protein [Kribbella albertanoniae]TDC14552.1 AIM24 family protein [Kribbella albertanoniae]
MRSQLFAAENQEQESAQPGLRLQNSKLLKVELRGEVFARQGAMVAYQGNVQFEAQGSGGIGKFIKQKLTGEGIPLMKMKGQGDVFLADRASDVYLIDLEGPHDGLSINGANVLAFEPTLSWDIQRVQGMGMMSNAGLFNCTFSGQGRLAITCKGTPVVLTVDQPTYADPQAAIAWSTNLQTGYQRADQIGLGTLLGRTTGEAFTMSFAGQGFVVVQPSEEPPGGAIGGTGSGTQSGQDGGVGGVLGGLLGGR